MGAEPVGAESVGAELVGVASDEAVADIMGAERVVSDGVVVFANGPMPGDKVPLTTGVPVEMAMPGGMGTPVPAGTETSIPLGAMTTPVDKETTPDPEGVGLYPGINDLPGGGPYSRAASSAL